MTAPPKVRATVQAAAGSPVRRGVGWAAAVVLGLVFVLAAYGKALDPTAFAEQITFEGLDFLLPAGFLAWFMIVVEVVLGSALIFDLRRRRTLVPVGLLIVFFLFLTGRAYFRWTRGELDDSAACGCFGNLVDRTPAEAFWQDLLLMVPPFLLAAWLPKRKEASRGKWLVVAILGVAAGIFAWQSPRLALDDFATKLRPGARVDEFCAGSSEPGGGGACLDLVLAEVLEGRHLVVIDSLDSPQIETTVDALDSIAAQQWAPQIWLLADTDDERVQSFFWQWGPRFEVREVPLALLRPLYRSLPRSFEVLDGTVVRTWPGLPDGPVASE